MRYLCSAALAAFLLLLPVSAEEATPVPVVMYHHVSPDASRAGEYVVTPEILEGDLRYLRERGYTAVSAAEIAAYSAGSGELPARPVLLTFDDGQMSFMAYALPLLEKYDMRAVVAVVGDYADEASRSGDKNPAYAYMGWEDIAALAATGRVEIACHTQSMHSLSGARRGCLRLPGEAPEAYFEALSRDLAGVEASIQEHTGARPAVFAYPYGLVCPEAAELVAGRGYGVALTCSERVTPVRAGEPRCVSLGRFNRSALCERERFFAKMGVE